MSQPLAGSPRSASFADVPRTVRDLIYLSIPTNVAGGFFSIYVSVFLLDLGVSAEIVGLALAADGATMVLSAIPLGIVSDRKGRKVMLILGSLLFSPILVILASTTETAWLVIAGVLGGVSEAAFLSTWNALIADGTPAASRNAAFSMSFIVSTTTGGLGFALPFIFPGLEGWTGLSIAALHRDTLVLFAVLSALTPIGLAVLLRGYREYLRPRTAPAGARPLGDRLRQLRGRLKELRLLLTFSGINGLIGLGAGFIVPLIGTWFRLRFGIPDAYSGPLLAVANLTMGFAAFTSPRLARHLGPVRAAALVQALSTVLMLSLAFVPNPFLAGGLYVVRAALMNMASPIMDAYLMDLVRPQERGFASALASIIWRMPNSASTVVGGWLLYQGQYQLPFLIAGGLYAVGVSLFFAVFHAIEPREHAAAESAEQGVRGS